jgi:spore maturation protein CgeB
MRIVLFCHSLLSDWNHGNAHFLRGVVSELAARGARVDVYEPKDAWSMQNLLEEPQGKAAIEEVLSLYPAVRPIRYVPGELDLEAALDGADLVLVHEWSDQALVKTLGELRHRGGRFRLLFHDTHHRSVTDEKSMASYDLRHYDGVLAFGRVIRDLYLAKGWTARAWTWHEAADTRVFRPVEAEKSLDLVWIGNWGDEERTAELQSFLLDPVHELGLSADVYGVRYPEHGKKALAEAGIRYRGWLPNHRAPSIFATARMTVHVPRRPYALALPGIPTIRPFEALACGIPLVTAPWDDAEGLFTPGEDFLVARTGEEMVSHLRALREDAGLRQKLATRGLATLRARHTCAHRVEELLAVCAELGLRTEHLSPRRITA